MRVFLVVFLVGILASCGGVDVPSVPQTPTPTAPSYPDLRGTWSDATGWVEACGSLDSRFMRVVVEAQSENRFAGTFAYRATTGDMLSTTFSGSVTEAGKLTGVVSSGQEVMDADLTAAGDLMFGTVTSAAYYNCTDGSVSKLEFDVSLERE